MIINVQEKDFGGKLRNGDILGVCNLVEHLRLIENNVNIQIHVPENSIQEGDFAKIFLEFVKKHSNYISDTLGTEYFNFSNLNVWDYRSLSGDLLKINNDNVLKENKVVIFPLFDAKYNIYRNWSLDLTKHIFKKYLELYPEYEVIICCPETYKDILSNFDLNDIKLSFNFLDNLNHISTAKIFVGGDTGTSHLAGSMTNPAKNEYYYASEEWFHTFPLKFRENGNMVLYSKYGCNL